MTIRVTPPTGIYVLRAGDTMTGDLHLGLNKLYLDDDSYMVLNGNSWELWVNGTKIQEWTVVATVPYLLMETGDTLLLETGDKLALEA